MVSLLNFQMESTGQAAESKCFQMTRLTRVDVADPHDLCIRPLIGRSYLDFLPLISRARGARARVRRKVPGPKASNHREFSVLFYETRKVSGIGGCPVS